MDRMETPLKPFVGCVVGESDGAACCRPRAAVTCVSLALFIIHVIIKVWTSLIIYINLHNLAPSGGFALPHASLYLLYMLREINADLEKKKTPLLQAMLSS